METPKKKKRNWVRTGTRRFKRLGRTRKKLQRWRKPKGRDNKIREKRAGRLKKVLIGFKNKKSDRGKVNGKIPINVENLKQAEKVEKGQLIIIAKVGKKKREALEKIIKEKGGEIFNKKKIKAPEGVSSDSKSEVKEKQDEPKK